jgi:hypothetical protein
MCPTALRNALARQKSCWYVFDFQLQVSLNVISNISFSHTEHSPLHYQNQPANGFSIFKIINFGIN